MTDTAAFGATLLDQAEKTARDLTIPPCPAILGRFAAEMTSERPDLRALADLIGNDVALSAAVITTVNSPTYGSWRKANSVRQALHMLGLRAGANLVAGLLLRNAFTAGSSAMMKHFWAESARMAETAADVAPHFPFIDRDVAHTFALFRDCGMAVMIAKFDNYEALVSANAQKPGLGLLLAEDSRYRFNHARVGYSLANGWHLPECLCNAILLHHDIDRFTPDRVDTNTPEAKLVAFGFLVEQVAALRSHRGLRPDWLLAEGFVLEALQLDAEQIVALCAGGALQEA